MSTDHKKRSRHQRNSSELLMDYCIGNSLKPYINMNNSNSKFGLTIIPYNFARKTSELVNEISKRKKTNDILAKCSPAEIHALINMTEKE